MRLTSFILVFALSITSTSFAEQAPPKEFPTDADDSLSFDTLMDNETLHAWRTRISGWLEGEETPSEEAESAVEERVAPNVLGRLSDEDKSFLGEIAETSNVLDANGNGMKPPNPFNRYSGKKDDSDSFIIFASREIPEADLKSIFREAAGKPNVYVVFRGIYDFETYNTGVSTLHRIIRDSLKTTTIKDAPNVTIDPVIFKELNVKTVPQIHMINKNRSVAHATGIFSPEWLRQEYHANNRFGNLGNYGISFNPTETDFIEMIRSRAERFQNPRHMQTIVDTYWSKRKLLSLPTAQKDSERLLDPSVVAPEDIYDLNGNLVVERGKAQNPLDSIPFSTRLIIFDGRFQNNVDFVKKYIQDNPYDRYMYITSDLPSDGWERLKDLSNEFDAPVYLLPKDVRERFGIRAVPSVVFSRGSYFVVQEFKPEPPALAEAS